LEGATTLRKSGDSRVTLTPRQTAVEFNRSSTGRTAGLSYGIQGNRSHSSVPRPVSTELVVDEEPPTGLVPATPLEHTVRASFRYTIMAWSIIDEFRTSRENAPIRSVPLGLISAKYAEKHNIQLGMYLLRPNTMLMLS